MKKSLTIPTGSSEFFALVHAAKWTAAHGDRDLAQALKTVIRQSYQHLRKQLWQQLSPAEQLQLKALMAEQQPALTGGEANG